MGPNWDVFLLSQQFINACQLVLLYALLDRVGTHALIKRIALIVFSTLYLLHLTHPWYNSTAFLLMLAASYCALGAGRVSASIAGLLAGLTILAKQDFGLITLIMGALFVSLTIFRSGKERIISNISSLKDKNLIRALVEKLVLFFTCAFVIVFACILLTDRENFLYWFNYGQAPHSVNVLSYKGFRLLYFALGCWLFFIALALNNLRLLISSIFILAASITRQTSGLSFTHYYFVAFIPIAIYEILRLNIPIKKLSSLLIIILCASIMLQPAINFYYAFESIIFGKIEPPPNNHLNKSMRLTAFPNDFLAFSSHTYAPRETIEAILELKLIASKRTRAKTGKNLRVLNITELTPIYAELGALPPKDLPLWFHNGISLFSLEKEKLKNILSSDEFDIVLLQGTDGDGSTVKNFLSIISINHSYTMVRKIHDSPFNSTSTCEINCQGDIFIFMKRYE